MKNRKENVSILLTSVGVATGPNIIHALRLSDEYVFRLIGADCDRLAAGLYLCDQRYRTPRIADPAFIRELKKICVKERVDILIPSLAEEISVLASHKGDFERIGVTLAIPDEEVVRLCDDKNLFVEYLSRHDIPAPGLYSYENVKEKDFPLFIKPILGSSSKNAQRVDDLEELRYAKKKYGSISIQELLLGPEFTIDLVCDMQGNFITGVIRERLEIKDGKAIKCRTVKDKTLMEQLRKILHTMKIRGPANAQCIKHKGVYTFFELNPRFSAGGLPLTVKSGANLPLLLVKSILGDHIDAKELGYKDNIYMTRYLCELFLDKNFEPF